MRWGDFRRSENVDDRRSEGPSLGSSGFRVGRGGLGIGAVFVILLVSWVFGTVFWWRGLEHAMLAHFSADLVLHVVAPLALAALA